MDNFIDLFERYCGVSIWLVIRRAYFDTSGVCRLKLWLSTVLFLVASYCYFKSSAKSGWVFLVVVALYGIWMYCYTAAIKSAFLTYYSKFEKRIRYYGKYHQYVRYLIFRDDVLSNFRGDVDGAITHLENQIATESHNPFSLHPIGSAIVATAISIIGASVNCKETDIFVATLSWLAIIWLWLWAYSSSTRTSAAKLKECHRFLLWLKEEPIDRLTGQYVSLNR